MGLWCADGLGISLQTSTTLHHIASLASSQTLPDPLPNINKKGESLEDFDHVLDMVGHGWA